MNDALLPLIRIRGVFRRHFYLWFRNPEYFFDTFWQPVVEVFIWGFISFYLKKAGEGFGPLVSFFLGAIILWAMLRRGQHEITFSFMEEAWSRNLQNLLMTPLSMGEFFAASILFGMVKMAFELTLMGVMMAFIFKFNVLTIGIALLPFSVSLLLTGWAIGLYVNAAIIYFGRGLIALSWIVVFVLQPFSCVFYPLAALPKWAQAIAACFPATWVFEGMRAVLLGQGFSWRPVLYSLGLNAIYLGAGFLLFSRIMKTARDKGLLTKLEW